MENTEGSESSEGAPWQTIQENTFTRWVNQYLRQADSSIDNLQTGFSDGLKLIALCEVLSHKKIVQCNKRPNFRSQKLENVNIALTFLKTEGLKLVNIDSSDIVDGKPKLVLGLTWALILNYSITTSSEKDPNHQEKSQTPKQKLLCCLQSLAPTIKVKNLTTDFQDGTKIGALVDGVAPGLCPDWQDWDATESVENATAAMELADRWLGVAKLISPEEMVSPDVDELSMMTYLAQFANANIKEDAPTAAKDTANNLEEGVRKKSALQGCYSPSCDGTQTCYSPSCCFAQQSTKSNEVDSGSQSTNIKSDEEAIDTKGSEAATIEDEQVSQSKKEAAEKQEISSCTWWIIVLFGIIMSFVVTIDTLGFISE